jgi:putative hydrolase of the HAD superfamily
MIKTIYVDLDGVIFQGAEKFSVKYAKEHKININDMSPFFINQFKLCLKGEADLKDELSKVLLEWKWHGTVGELVDYWIKDDSKPNIELIEILNELSKNEINVFIVTQQEKNRARQLKSYLGKKLNYSGFYSTHEIHYLKPDTQFYLECLKRTENKANEALFIDDDIRNINSAKEVGLNTILYEDNKLTIDKISSLINASK